jgi:hypothetical protein
MMKCHLCLQGCFIGSSFIHLQCYFKLVSAIMREITDVQVQELLFCWLCILIYACNYIHYMHLGVTVCLMLVSYLHNNVMFHKLFQFVRAGSVYEKTWWYYGVWWIFIMFKVCNFSWFSLLPRDSRSCVCSFCVSFCWSICFLISTSNAVSVLAC